MIFKKNLKSPLSLLETYSWSLVIAWTIIIGSLLLFGISQIRHVQREMIKKEARANFNKDQALRFWGAIHGGVYVPVTKETPSNPYLGHVPERDIKTPSGKSLTLMNPAYMLRQTMERYEDLYGVRGHLTSLKHFRPETAPDEWEKYALKKFEQGAQEVFEFTDIDGEPYFRLMSPMIEKTGCLKCHGHQGYKVGDVRGGVSVSVPMAPYLANQKRQTIVYAISFAILWVLGFTGINLATRRLRLRIGERDKAEAELQKAHEELEMRVEKRTAELKEVNEQLRKEIKERNLAEEALRESEEKYRSMMESMKDATYICSPEFHIEYMNPAMIKRIGRDATGETCHKVIYDSDAKCSWCAFDKILRGENYEYELLNPKNNHYYTISNSPIHRTDGSISKLIIFRDITEARNQREQLQQAHKMEAIGTLAGGIAHQFNNALAPITVNIDMLELDFPDEEKIAAYTKQMKNSANRMAQLTDQLLAYARGGKYQPKIVSLSDFMRHTLPLIRHTIDPSIQIDTDIPLDMFSIKADMTQMEMILSAILANASEAMEDKGLIRVTCRNETITEETITDFPDLKPGAYVKLIIEDDGKGMDEEIRSRIFEPFFTTKFQGRGLGMAAVYGIIKNHDGGMSVYSELGKGTSVHIYLPAVEAPVKEPKKPKIEPAAIKGIGTILVIEDEEMVMDVTTAMLERLGYRVLGAKTGQEAIFIAKTFGGQIDLAILDIVLPDMDGKAIYPRIMEARPNLKILVCSGYSIEGPAQEIINAGAQGFIQKPFTIAEISEKLKEILEI